MTSDILGTIGSGVNLAGSIASLFGSDGNQNTAQNSSSKLLSAQRPYQYPIVTPGYTFGGGALVDRGNSYANANQNLNQLYGNQLGALNAFSTGNLAPLSARLDPGYGQLTNAMVGAAQSKGQQAYGNLRDQLARRNVLGASFANNQLSQQGSQNLQDENLARAQAFQQEMQSRLGLNQQQMDVLAQQLANANAQSAQVNAQAQQKLGELGIAAGFLKNVNQIGSPLSDAYKTAAIQQATGSTASPGAMSGGGGDTATAGGGGSTANPAFAGLPMPGASDNKWKQAYQQFAANNDVEGYKAYLRSRGLTV